MQQGKRAHAHANEFVLTPTNRLTCYFADREDFQGAMRAFAAAGFHTSDIHVLQGQEGIDSLDLDGRKHGTLARLSRLMQSILADSEIHEYEKMQAHLEQGHIVIAAPARDADEKARVHEIMHDNNGHHITYFARFYLETIEE